MIMCARLPYDIHVLYILGSYYWRSIAGAAATALLAYLIWFSQESAMP